MKKILTRIILFAFCLIVFAVDLFAYETLEIKYKGRINKVHYALYLPENPQPGEKFPVLICIGGLPVYDGVYAYSNTQECMTDAWRNFADNSRIAVLGLGFLFVPEDWPQKESYQYAQAWSGKALQKILKILKKVFPLKPDALCMYGVSAGAQFSIRFAQMDPNRVVAVTAHAAGGYDIPQKFIPVKFLLTVGELDMGETPRFEMAKQFTRLSKDKGIDITLEIIEGIAHRQTIMQDDMSRAFIKENLQQIQNMGR